MTELKVAYLSQERIEATPAFIEKNKLSLKSQEEVLVRFEEAAKKNNVFDHTTEVLIYYLPFDKAKAYYKDEYVKEVESGAKPMPGAITNIVECCQDFLDYMNFAWGKAQDERGLSAARSINKLGNWLWLMNRDDLRMLIDDDELYNPYGAPALIAVCNDMGIEVPQSLIEFSKVKC